MNKKGKKKCNILRRKRKAGKKMDSKNVAFIKAGRNLFSYADFSNSIFTEKKIVGEYTNEEKHKEKRGYRKTYQNNK